jgi:hypothetical protein
VKIAQKYLSATKIQTFVAFCVISLGFIKQQKIMVKKTWSKYFMG